MVRDARSVMHRSRYRVRGTLSLGHFSLSTGCFEAHPTIIVSEQHLDWPKETLLRPIGMKNRGAAAKIIHGRERKLGGN